MCRLGSLTVESLISNNLDINPYVQIRILIREGMDRNVVIKKILRLFDSEPYHYIEKDTHNEVLVIEPEDSYEYIVTLRPKIDFGK